MTPIKTVIILGKYFLLICFSPLISGFICKIKNNLRMRKGPSIFQPYCNLAKLFSKDQVVSRQASVIFYAAPAIVIAASLSACFLLFAIPAGYPAAAAGILLAIFFILSLSRFFLALAGLDAASSFGGMGSSREMFISSFAEPTVFIAAFVLCMNGVPAFMPSNLLAGFALLMAVIAETSRIPVDNRETHLELTMVHEAMVLEYSGKSLALIELAGHIKQAIFFTILSWYLFPFTAGSSWTGLLFAGKICIISLAICFIEISVAKMRLFRVVDFLSFSFFIALLAAVCAALGL